MSVDVVACPGCGARNPATAQWCSQCYDPLGAPPPVEDVAPPPPAVAAPTSTTGDDRFRVVDGLVEWHCEVCGAWSSVDHLACPVCATPMDGGASTRDRAGVDVSRVRRMALLVPAGGQWVLGDRGKAFSRMLMSGVWLLGAVVILVAGGGAPATFLPALLLLLGVALLWGLSFLDASTVAGGGRRELLDGRAFLWLVVGVLGAVLASLLLQLLGRSGT